MCWKLSIRHKQCSLIGRDGDLDSGLYWSEILFCSLPNLKFQLPVLLLDPTHLFYESCPKNLHRLRLWIGNTLFPHTVQSTRTYKIYLCYVTHQSSTPRAQSQFDYRNTNCYFSFCLIEARYRLFSKSECASYKDAKKP